MHSTYDGLDNIGPKDGLISYDEIKRALGQTTHEEWKKEIEPHDDGDQLLTVEGRSEFQFKIVKHSTTLNLIEERI